MERKMIKNIILYIFIYVFMMGCESPLESEFCESQSHINMASSNLVLGDDGYYHMLFIDGYIQTFGLLEASTGVIHWPVGWISNKEYNIEFQGQDNWTNLVNQTSYTDDEGIARTVLGVWEVFVGDTIKVYAGYHDECDIHHVDSLEVIVW